MMDVERIREGNPIVDVVGEIFDLKQQGSHFIGTQHDSLVVNPATGWYHWNSRDEHGDVFDFAGRHLLGHGSHWSSHDPGQFFDVVKVLAERAGIPVAIVDKETRQQYQSERVLIRRLQQVLQSCPEALDYATQRRGWSEETLQREQLGFMPADKRPLLKNLELSDKWLAVINRFPSNMLVYVHMQNGRLVYLSGRSIEGKQHYNPPCDLIGERQPYFNQCYHRGCDTVAVVEGQADAITLSQWGIPAVALAGMNSSAELIDQLKNHRRVYIMLDNTTQARLQALELARQIGSTACLPVLPAAIKDANEWLVKQQATAKQVQAVLNAAQPLIEAEVQHIKPLTGLARQDAVNDLIQRAASWDKLEQAALKRLFKDHIGISCTYFNDMLKAHQKNQPTGQTGQPTILSDDIPLLSPALGFTEDTALVTVSIMERTARNRLNIQPYLVTSQRELRRLDDAQIIELDGKEAALRVIPEGTEFLMRWRYRDIQRFLEGETVDPTQVFLAVHDLFTKHIDFTSDVDASIVTLWVIGTYFYTGFMAYPYLALNGPKNSGKSTVLSVAKPLAFNMVTSSDLTGPSLFRLIHQNACSVGIDEAERYHNPRDPEMQQIRQLLNSGYKPGMPAIRLMGDDMKPKAFDVYSPKMLANIMGLEDILASRCIAIPMRRTNRKMPVFPPTYDGAPIRHLLYTLALTHFREIQHNYRHRPELHRLNNRSHELWSPLVALAAFFEEAGQLEGLVESIQEAAERDVVLSEGKALSPREEAILQSLELLTRDREDDTTWVKAVDLRAQVRELLVIPEDKMGSAQWVGHIMKRLQLTDRTRRKAYSGGQMYLIQRKQVEDMMDRYEVETVEN
ncbi:MAG: toprim domain-containing protein [Chloroflexi bacterium]|nr:toprim domain-containing protein [Chloroflexota bacterium]